ncbi:MAG: hypothetical protein DLM58_09050 [Pseudonocardiales bacterium]|nr:MAG: hypothetical protein DLM58_09050 [Pseudonocardiales bacterium]
MSTPTIDTPPAKVPLSAARRMTLTIGIIPVAVLVVIGAFLVTGFSVTNQPFDYASTVPASSGTVVVKSDNASLNFTPSGDNAVHVSVHGSYSGHRPGVSASRQGNQVMVYVECRSGWRQQCRIDVSVSVPSKQPITVHDTNGSVTAQNLAGDLELGSTNGSINVAASTGPITMTTSNGSIDANQLTSQTVDAKSSNGAISIAFATPPQTVNASTSNGSIDIHAPITGGASYYAQVSSTRGAVLLGDGFSDRFATRTINATTSNGRIEIGP